MHRVEPVSVTGMGCVCAAGFNVPDCLAALEHGQRAPRQPTRFCGGHTRPYPVFEVPDAALPHGQDNDLSRTVRLAMRAAREALDQAGLDPTGMDSGRVGVCIGTSVGASLNFLDFYRRARAGEAPDLQPIRRYLQSNPATAVARLLGTTGPAQTVVNACSSGTDAIGLGAAWIRQGLCDVVLAGGADELSEITYAGFIRLMITDEHPCRPFDAARRGLNLGEGAGMIVLEADSHRAQRGAGRLAAVLGYGTAGDAHHPTAPHPEGLGLRRAITDALDQAGLAIADLAFVNAHGTGTANNDQAEAGVFSSLLTGIPFIATKGMTGHTLGAAGAIEAIFTMGHLRAGLLPASAGFTDMDPSLGVLPTTAPTPVRGVAALSQSLAFGGNNSVLALGLGAQP